MKVVHFRSECWIGSKLLCLWTVELLNIGLEMADFRAQNRRAWRTLLVKARLMVSHIMVKSTFCALCNCSAAGLSWGDQCLLMVATLLYCVSRTIATVVIVLLCRVFIQASAWEFPASCRACRRRLSGSRIIWRNSQSHYGNNDCRLLLPNTLLHLSLPSYICLFLFMFMLCKVWITPSKAWRRCGWHHWGEL